MQKNLSLDLLRPAHLLFLLSITLITGLIAGSYPAHFLSAFRAALVLKGTQEKRGGAAGFRRILVVSQFAVSVTFIIATIVIFRQIRHLEDRDLGFNRTRLIELDWQHDIGNRFPVVQHELIQTGMVANVALSGHSLLESGDSDDRFSWDGKPASMQRSFYFREVSAGFIDVTGLKLIEGEGFSGNPSVAEGEVVINESMQNLMGKGSAIGKIIRSPRGMPDGQFKNLVVRGVIKDYVYGDAGGSAEPVIFLTKKPGFQFLVYTRLKPGIPVSSALVEIARVHQSLNPGYPMQYRFVDDQYAAMFSQEVALSKMAGTFSLLAVFISCLGLFGLAAFSAERRTKEISIRKLLGAGTAGLAMMLSKEFLRLVGIACLISFPFAWWMMNHWLQDYAYRVDVSPWIFIATALAAGVLCLATVSMRTLKTIHGNLVRQLRSE